MSKKSGVLFSIDEAVDLFFKGFNKKKIASLVIEIKELIEDKEEHIFIDDIEDIYELKSWFVSFCQKQVENCIILNQDNIINIWNIIVNKTKLKIPEATLGYFSSKVHDCSEIPTDTVCIIFCDSGLFETKMSKKGEAVAKAMGLKKIKQTIWNSN